MLNLPEVSTSNGPQGFTKSTAVVAYSPTPLLTLCLNTVKIVTVSSTRTWTPPVPPGSAPASHASSSPSSPASEDQLPSPRAYTGTTFEHCSSNADSAGVIQCHESAQCSSGSDAVPSIGPQFSIGCDVSERAGVVFDNSTLQKW